MNFSKTNFYGNIIHVIRCKDCKNFKTGKDGKLCEKFKTEMPEYGYCSEAKSKKEFEETEYF